MIIFKNLKLTNQSLKQKWIKQKWINLLLKAKLFLLINSIGRRYFISI